MRPNFSFRSDSIIYFDYSWFKKITLDNNNWINSIYLLLLAPSTDRKNTFKRCRNEGVISKAPSAKRSKQHTSWSNVRFLFPSSFAPLLFHFVFPFYHLFCCFCNFFLCKVFVVNFFFSHFRISFMGTSLLVLYSLPLVEVEEL